MSDSTSTLAAATIGSAVPAGSFPLAIHSVFPGAVNLQPAGGGMLVTLLTWAAPELPQGIRLTTTEDFTTRGLEPHGRGRSTQAGIFLDRHGAPPLHVAFSKAVRAVPAPLPCLGPPGPAWQLAATLLGQAQAQAGTDLRLDDLLGQACPQGGLGRRLASAARALGDAVRAAAPGALRTAFSSLVGLGCGLTPSGDDFLCGFLIAAHCRTTGDRQRLELLQELQASTQACLAGTNTISATFLRCAAEGKACSSLQDLVQAFQDGTDCRKALADLCAIGHSSGMDLTTGFLYGLSLWA